MEKFKIPNSQTEKLSVEKSTKDSLLSLKKVIKEATGSNRFAKELKNKTEHKIETLIQKQKEMSEQKENNKTGDDFIKKHNEKKTESTKYLWPKFDIVTPLAEEENFSSNESTEEVEKNKRKKIWVPKKPEKVGHYEIADENKQVSLSKNTLKINNDTWTSKEEKTSKLAKKLLNKIFDYNKKNKKGADKNKKTNTETTNNIKNGAEDEIRPLPKTEDVALFIEGSNRSLWGKISSGAKEIMSNAYEGIYMTPGLNKVVGKMEIAYNQFWMDQKEGKASRLKDKMDSFGSQNNILENVKSEISKASSMLEEMGLPGVASNLRAEKRVEDQISKNENKMDRLQGRIEKRENRIKIFANKRDAIADRLITHYERKLSPIEGKLEVLENRRNEIELFCTSSLVKLEEQRARIKEIEETRAKIEANYARAGYSDRQIRKNTAVKNLNDQISSLYINIQLEQAKIAERRNKINEKIAKINKKAEPYRNKKNEFIRVKSNRPIDFKLEERKYTDEWKGTEEIRGHTREQGDSIYERQNNQIKPENNTERLYPSMERFDDLTERWNVLVVENSEYVREDRNGIMQQDSEYLLIKPEEIMGATRMREYNQMTKESFLKIVEQFYKIKKIEKSIYQKIINKFI